MFISIASKELGTQAGRQELVNKAAELIDEMGYTLYNSLKPEVFVFLNGVWRVAEANNSNAGAYIAQTLNLAPGDALYDELSIASDLAEAMSIINTAVEEKTKLGDSPFTIAYHIMQELLAYQEMTSELLLGKGPAPNAEQKKFIGKFLRAVKQGLKRILGLNKNQT